MGDIYELTAPSKGVRWGLQFLARFNLSGGAVPFGSPTFDKNGNLYGTAFRGGHKDGGVIYSLIPEGILFVLYKFDQGGRVGVNPQSSVTADAFGNLFGTTTGGSSNGKGAVWQILAH